MTKLVGILNITPDSFGTPPLAPEGALAAALRLIEDGADVLDVGAESTRPNATEVPPDEEWGRLEPGLEAIVAAAHARGVVVSLDTRHPETAAKGLAVGVDMINDVSGGTPAMDAVVAGAGCGYVIMHSLSVPPRHGEHLPDGTCPVAAVSEWFLGRRATLDGLGIARARVIVDPGIGFGKTPAQSMTLIARAAQLRAVSPLLIGHSRKSFLRPLLPDGHGPAERDDVTLALSAALIASQVDYLRVHAVARHKAICDTYRPR